MAKAPKKDGPSEDAGIYDVFLCHNGADKAWVRELAEQIESETFDGTATGRKLRAFFDEWDIDVGQNIILRLNEGLKKARYVAVILSPEMLEAPWPSFEWTHIASADPINARGRLVPLFLRDYSEKLNKRAEFPAPFLSINWIDFRSSKEFRRSFQKLIRKLRDQPPARGRPRAPLASQSTVAPLQAADLSCAPDPIRDVILANLLPVLSYPQTVWFAPTQARTAQDIFQKVESPPAFELQEQRLYTFSDLTSPTQPLRTVVDTAQIRSVPLGEWKNDPVRWRWCVSLLHRCLRNHLSRFPIFRDARGRYFFKPDQCGDRVWKNKADRPRTVAARKTNLGGTMTFWVHQGARLAFLTLGDGLYLRIDPCYVFTTDGQTPLKGKSVTSLASRWGGKERNAAILRHVVFWARTLLRQGQQIELETGAVPVIVSAVPTAIQTSFGIEFDRVEIKTLLTQVEDELGLAAEAISDSDFQSDEDDEESDRE